MATANDTQLKARGSKRSASKLDAGEIMCRLGDCKGAVRLAIDAILIRDEVLIDAAMGALRLADSELARLSNDIDLAELARSHLRARKVEVAHA